MCKSICLEQQPVKNDISIVILIFNSTILYYSFKILSARSIPVNFAFPHEKKVQNRILLKHEILPKILQRLLAVPKSMQHTKSELLHISSHMDSSVLLFTLYRWYVIISVRNDEWAIYCTERDYWQEHLQQNQGYRW